MSDFTATEDDPDVGQGGGGAGDAGTPSGWTLTGLSCLNGVGQPVDVAYDLASRTVDFTGVSAAASVEALPVTCAFTNHCSARSTLPLVKEVTGADEETGPDPAAWTLTATGNDPTTTGTAVSGTSGSSEVTSQVTLPRAPTCSARTALRATRSTGATRPGASRQRGSSWTSPRTP